MKKLFILCSAFVIALACKEEPKDYVTLFGQITDKNSDSLVVRNRNYSKTIKVKPDGTFSDTLKINSDFFNFYDGNKSTLIFLKNGYDLNITLDAKEFAETIKYSGIGSETNNYLAKKALLQKNKLTPVLFDLEEDDFKKQSLEIKNQFLQLLEGYKNIDSIVLVNDQKGIDKLAEGLLRVYQQQQARANQFSDFIGKPSPTFSNYENYKGGTTSLADLKGKYVYIDVWATWCGPCKKEIPSLKKIEKQYHGKNIEFVSISVDDGRGFKAETPELALATSKEGWRKMIAEKKMGGIQLFSDNAWKSDFIKGYKIQGIPRFILIDPSGNIISADAPRPSSPKLIKLFTSLNI